MIRRDRRGFLFAYVLLVLGTLLLFSHIRAARQLATARHLRQQVQSAQLLAMAEGAIERTRHRLENGAPAAALTPDRVEYSGGESSSEVGAAGPNRWRLRAVASLDGCPATLALTVVVRMESQGPGRRTVVESWRERVHRGPVAAGAEAAGG